MELWLNADHHFLIRWEDAWWSWVEMNLIFFIIGHRAVKSPVSVSGRSEAINP
jgi:hypothetical protein